MLEIYNSLRREITVERLKRISAEVIIGYRKKNERILYAYARILEIPFNGTHLSRLFAEIIKVYHPDRYNKILRDVEIYYSEGNHKGLLRYRDIYLFDENLLSESNIEPDYTVTEEYGFSSDESGYHEERSGDDIFKDFRYDDIADEDEAADTGFTAAVNRHAFGSNEFSLNSHDLASLDGELDLSDYDIIDLDGVEYCVNLTGLNLSGNSIYRISRLASLTRLETLYLSGNSIDSIDALRGLARLKELDLSFNRIEDISVLLELRELEYVNLLGNPLKENDLIDKLVKRGVVVVF